MFTWEKAAVWLLCFQPTPNRSELKLMLFPGQSVKIQSLINIMVHQRDILTRLQADYQDSSTSMGGSFVWRSQLKYRLDDDTRNISISVSSQLLLQ